MSTNATPGATDSHIEPPTDLSGFDRQILTLHASSMMVSAKAMPPSPTRAYLSGLAQELLEQARAPEIAPTDPSSSVKSHSGLRLIAGGAM